MKERMRDAAFANNIAATWTGAVGGYLHVGSPYNPWTPADWARFSGNKKLPIAMIRSTKGRNAEKDAFATVYELWDLKASRGSMVALDLEMSVDPAYTALYGRVMAYCGFHVLVYGSTSTLFKNPSLHGYWAASLSSNGAASMHSHPAVLMTQYAINVNNKHDSTAIKWNTWTNKLWWI